MSVVLFSMVCLVAVPEAFAPNPPRPSGGLQPASAVTLLVDVEPLDRLMLSLDPDSTSLASVTVSKSSRFLGSKSMMYG